MRLRFLLDTNICIYIAKRRPLEVLERFKKLHPGEVGMSVITYGELCYGAGKSTNPPAAQQTLRELSALIPVLPLGPQAGERYGRIRRELERTGRLIGNNDLWIAAHAGALGVVLVTNNDSEFGRVDGLAVENWVRPPLTNVHETTAKYGASSRQRNASSSLDHPRRTRRSRTAGTLT
jgi:tRNA(fMet)-specific endonuclease VapC